MIALYFTVGAPYTFVTTEQVLVTFGLTSLRDLPDREQLEDAGIAGDDVSPLEAG